MEGAEKNLKPSGDLILSSCQFSSCISTHMHSTRVYIGEHCLKYMYLEGQEVSIQVVEINSSYQKVVVFMVQQRLN